MLADPFWVPVETAIHLTDRQLWELFVKPQLDRQRREQMEQARTQAAAQPSRYVDCEDSPEMALRQLASLGLLDPVEVEKTIAAGQAAEQKTLQSGG